MTIPAIPAHGASWDSWAAGIDAAARSAVPKWQPSTAYTAGALVLNPSGQIVSANTAFTSGASYSGTNWTVVSGGGGTVSDATTTSKGVVQLAGDLSGTAVAPTVPGLANKLTAKNNTTTLSPALTDYWQKVEVIDDGTTTTSWPNRLEVAFTPSGGTRGLTTYLNEYGELRVEPAKSNTVAARFFTKHQPGDAAHTVNVFEMMDDRTTRTVLMSIDASGNVHAPNLPNKITVASTAPSSPAVNDLWVDLSA